MPRKLVGLYNDKFNSLGASTMTNNTHLGTLKDRGSNDNQAHWVFTTTTYVDAPQFSYDVATGKVTLSTDLEGATIYYTTDGSTPTAVEGNKYTAPIELTSSMTEIKTILVTSDSKISNVVSIPLANYTYHILNTAGTVAIQHAVTQPVGVELSGYSSIPSAIASPYIEDENIEFFNNSAHGAEHKITVTPATTDIYVTYSTTHLSNKFMQLNGARILNITVNGDYIFDNSGTLDHDNDATTEEKATRRYQWFFEGGDPYAVQIRNTQNDNYLGYTTSPEEALLLAGSPANKNFIIMSTSNGDGYQQMELMAATGNDSYYHVGRSASAFTFSTTSTGSEIQVIAYTNKSSVTYHLIDQAGKDLLQISSTSDTRELPSEWQSPMVSTYHYWKVGAFDKYDNNTTYKLKADPSSYVINSLLDVTDSEIYVTYDVNDNITFDTQDNDKTGSTAYMLKFYGGESFYQEDGKDGVMTTKQQAVYPYSNGDAMLYVYGQEQWNTQLSSGASTRQRWLWYPVSPDTAKVNTGTEQNPNMVPVTPGYKGDPYHVKIMSHSGQADSHNYFRTYVVNYGGINHVVTGVTTKNEDVDKTHANQLPTEYMVLNAPNSRYKLVTVNKIALDINGDGDYSDEGEGTDHRIVTSFEQYWKNNPTIQNILAVMLWKNPKHIVATLD